MRKKVPGYIRDVPFRNVEVAGRPGAYRVQLAGADAQHDVRNVTFDNVSILGNRLVRSSAVLSVGDNVDELRFLDASERPPLPVRPEPGP